MNRTKDLAKNTLIISIGTFLPKLAALITLPIITNHLTKVEYGTYDLLSTLVALLLPVVTLQIHSAAFRFLIECRERTEEKKRVISNIYSFLLPTSIITLIVLYLCLNKINTFTRVLVVLYFFVDIFLLSTQQVVRGLSYNKLYSASAVIQSVINTLLIIFTVSYGHRGLNGVLMSFIIATMIGILFLFISAKLFGEIDFKLTSFVMLKKMLQYSWPMIPNTLSSWVLSTSDRLVLTGFMGLEAVAVYAAANKIPLLLTSVQGTFIFAWQENASLALSDDDVGKYYSDIYDKFFSALAGIMALLIGSTPILFLLLIKGDYADSYPHMPILFMGIFFSSIASFFGGIYVAHKRTKSVGITTMIAAVCNLSIDLLLIQKIGIYAASISTLISYTILSIYRMYDVKKFQAINYNLKKTTLCLVTLLGMCVLCWINNILTNTVNFLFGFVFFICLNRKLLINMFLSIKSRINNT